MNDMNELNGCYVRREDEDFFAVSLYADRKKGTVEWEPIRKWYKERFPGKKKEVGHWMEMWPGVIPDVIEKHFSSAGKRLMTEGACRLNFGVCGALEVEILEQTAPYGFLTKVHFTDQKGGVHEKNSDAFRSLCNRFAVKQATVSYKLPMVGKGSGDFNDFWMCELKHLYRALDCIHDVRMAFGKDDFYRMIVKIWESSLGGLFNVGEAGKVVIITGGLTRSHLGDDESKSDEFIRATVGQLQGSQVPIRSGVHDYGHCGAYPWFDFKFTPGEDYSHRTQKLENLAELVNVLLRYSN